MGSDARPEAFVFDAYGTLYDVHSVAARCESCWPGKGAQLSQLWRAKQLEYTWLRSLTGSYADFERITGDALSHACASLGLGLSPGRHAQLMAAYLQLAPYADARAALSVLAGRPLAILSNAVISSL